MDKVEVRDCLELSSVKTGAQILLENDFSILSGKRVGLIANHTALVDTTHITDLLAATPSVELVALFGPEHGIRGEVDDAKPVPDSFDNRIGLPVYSLYGDRQKPQLDVLDGLDVLVFDIQDVGARFYTYISTMGLAMQAAAASGRPFVVLDRPNPLGGITVSGYVLEPAHISFLGQYPIPIQHGLTVGELAWMIQSERLLPGLDDLQLEVVQMEGWRREMLWPDTGLPWVRTSPNIPDFETALLYPGACFFEATAASEGRGTHTPFKLLGAPWINDHALAAVLNAYRLPGVLFEAAAFTPQPIEGMESRPKLQGQFLRGIRQFVTEPCVFQSVETGIHVLHTFFHLNWHQHLNEFVDREEWLKWLAGTTRLCEQLRSGASPGAMIAGWQDEVNAFKQQRASYLLYY